MPGFFLHRSFTTPALSMARGHGHGSSPRAPDSPRASLYRSPTPTSKPRSHARSLPSRTRGRAGKPDASPPRRLGPAWSTARSSGTADQEDYGCNPTHRAWSASLGRKGYSRTRYPGRFPLPFPAFVLLRDQTRGSRALRPSPGTAGHASLPSSRFLVDIAQSRSPGAMSALPAMRAQALVVEIHGPFHHHAPVRGDGVGALRGLCAG